MCFEFVVLGVGFVEDGLVMLVPQASLGRWMLLERHKGLLAKPTAWLLGSDTFFRCSLGG